MSSISPPRLISARRDHPVLRWGQSRPRNCFLVTSSQRITETLEIHDPLILVPIIGPSSSYLHPINWDLVSLAWPHKPMTARAFHPPIITWQELYVSKPPPQKQGLKTASSPLLLHFSDSHGWKMKIRGARPRPICVQSTGSFIGPTGTTHDYSCPSPSRPHLAGNTHTDTSTLKPKAYDCFFSASPLF